ncbi:hypothetical protein EI42_05019 [Thermosporothrix hazakensis]|jgi:hypothetical protein|uniref:Uncharacterized protein n=2 Tax=Thermosporothrix TaxID=768650 RepID=A0A326U031_THEHA|nr:hypothetical protein [Thermosporothrix hazakensis]PZW23397.1 hypothetical protein EI42_05019 [Thermosporothrix hazakensis]
MIPEEIQQRLRQHGITDLDEVALRQALERYTPTYTLIRLADWPARRWKCRYRLLLSENMYDAQSVPEAYARGILALIDRAQQASS